MFQRPHFFLCVDKGEYVYASAKTGCHVIYIPLSYAMREAADHFPFHTETQPQCTMDTHRYCTHTCTEAQTILSWHDRELLTASTWLDRPFIISL